MGLGKLYPYDRDARCPKCLSQFTAEPLWHRRKRRLLLSMSGMYWCDGLPLDHLHSGCRSCGFGWVMACADIVEEAHCG